MLAGRQRLRRRGEFTAAIRTGHRAGRGSVVVHLRRPTGQARTGQAATAPAGLERAAVERVRVDVAEAPARAGFIVSRSVGNAVTRNLVQRRLRHLMRERLGRFEPGTDVVVRALPQAAARTYAQLGADLDTALAAALR